jgi:multidrug resistance efflux pump
MKKLLLTLITMSGIILLLTACSPKAEAATSTPISTQPDGIIAEAHLLPLNNLAQSFSISGQVSEVLVADGETVTTGQVLVRLTASQELQTVLIRAQQEALAAQQSLDALEDAADLNIAEAKLALLKAQDDFDTAVTDFEDDQTDENQALLDLANAKLSMAEKTHQILKDNNGINPDLLAAAQARLNSAAAAIASAQAALDALELKASTPGVVVDTAVQVGQRVTPGQIVMTVADFSGWMIKTDNLSEVDVVKVKVGQPVEIVLDALPSTTFAGEVTQISSRFEEKRGDITYTVTAVLKQIDPQMRWGMTAAVNFLP